MWKEQRRFLHERLRHFGMKHMGDGREKMEARIMVKKKKKKFSFQNFPRNFLFFFNFEKKKKNKINNNVYHLKFLERSAGTRWRFGD